MPRCPKPAPMHIVYALTWSRLHREAMRDQSVSTAAAFARAGHRVTLLMPRRLNDPPLTAADLRAFYGVEGDFDVVQRPSAWSGPKLFGAAMWLRQVFRDPLLGGADVLYSREPAMLGIGHRSPVPFAFEHYRLWPDKYRWLRPFMRRSTGDAKCLGVILHSRHAAEAYARARVAGDRLLVAHNGSEAARLGEPMTRAAARERLGLPVDRAIAAYSGRIGGDKALDRIAEIARLRPEVLFLLVGDDGSREAARAAPKGDNIRLVPWQEHKTLGPWLWAADVLLVPPSRAPLDKFGNCVLPIKLFTYLAAGRPILAPDAPDTRELLSDGETALLVEPDRGEAAAQALDRLLGEPGLAARLSANALALAEELTWDRRAQAIAAFLGQRLAQPPLYAGGEPAMAVSRASSSNM
jgi:glycosyltransferase involved in cell wall biosynthesis